MSEQSGSGPSVGSMLAVVSVSAVIAAFATGALFFVIDRLDQTTIRVTDMPPADLVVQVDGAVATPGVYTLPGNARLFDVVDAAGGFGDRADVTGLNLAARIGDGESIAIPSIVPESLPDTSVQPDPATTVEGVEPGADGLISVNTASQADLETLPGIGPVIGERIVTYRQVHGSFASVDALTAVDGISDRTVDELRPLITIDE